MDKRTPRRKTSLSRGERKDEVSKRDQHLLPQVQTPHSTCRRSLQGGQAADPIVGSQTTRKTKTRLRRAENFRTETHRPDNPENPCPNENPNLPPYKRKTGYQA